MTSLAKCFLSTHRTLCDFLIDYIKFTHILTPYKVPQRLSLICPDFSGDRSWEETASVIQFVGRERVHKLTCNYAREGHPHGQQKLLVRTPQNLCRDKIMFVATKYLSRHAYFSHDKRPVLSWQTCVCRDKIKLVTTKVVSQQAYFCHDKSPALLRQRWYLRQLTPMPGKGIPTDCRSCWFSPPPRHTPLINWPLSLSCNHAR